MLKKLSKKEKDPDNLKDEYDRKLMEVERNFGLNQEINSLKQELQRLASQKKVESSSAVFNPSRKKMN